MHLGLGNNGHHPWPHVPPGLDPKINAEGFSKTHRQRHRRVADELYVLNACMREKLASARRTDR